MLTWRRVFIWFLWNFSISLSNCMARARMWPLPLKPVSGPSWAGRRRRRRWPSTMKAEETRNFAEATLKSTPFSLGPITKLTYSKVKVILRIFRGRTWTRYFTGEKYWKLEGETIASGYPRSIRTDWEGLPGNIDAAFTWTNGRTYFFKVGSLKFRAQIHIYIMGCENLNEIPCRL